MMAEKQMLREDRGREGGKMGDDRGAGFVYLLFPVLAQASYQPPYYYVFAYLRYHNLRYDTLADTCWCPCWACYSLSTYIWIRYQRENRYPRQGPHQKLDTRNALPHFTNYHVLNIYYMILEFKHDRRDNMTAWKTRLRICTHTRYPMVRYS